MDLDGAGRLIVMRAIYCRGLAGTPIRWAQGFAQWSHGGVLMPDNTVINARVRQGVVREPLDEFLERYTQHDIVDIYTPSDAEAYAQARSMVGMGYGYGEVFNFLTQKLGRFDSPGRVECIELIERCAMAGGRIGELRRFREHVQPHQITPQQSYITR